MVRGGIRIKRKDRLQKGGPNSKYEPLNEENVNIAYEQHHGNTPLHLAIIEDDMERTKEILAVPGIQVNKVNEDGDTPLYIALRGEKQDEVKALLAAPGILVNESAGMHHNNSTPLHIATQVGNTEIVKALIAKQGIQINKSDQYGLTPLHVAAYFGYVDIVKILLEAGASIEKVNNDGQTPLHMASSEGRVEEVKVLLRAGATVNKRDKSGKTPLMYANLRKNEDIIDLLMYIYLRENPNYTREHAEAQGMGEQWQRAVERNGVTNVVYKSVQGKGDEKEGAILPLEMIGKIEDFIGGKRKTKKSKTKKSKAKKGSKKRVSRRNKK
jgi:hypothetical protein